MKRLLKKANYLDGKVFSIYESFIDTWSYGLDPGDGEGRFLGCIWPINSIDEAIQRVNDKYAKGMKFVKKEQSTWRGVTTWTIEFLQPMVNDREKSIDSLTIEEEDSLTNEYEGIPVQVVDSIKQRLRGKKVFFRIEELKYDPDHPEMLSIDQLPDYFGYLAAKYILEKLKSANEDRLILLSNDLLLVARDLARYSRHPDKINIVAAILNQYEDITGRDMHL